MFTRYTLKKLVATARVENIASWDFNLEFEKTQQYINTNKAKGLNCNMKNYLKMFLFCLAIVFVILFGVVTYKGYDKLTNYYNSEFGVLNKNAYVGGDAYNYIINGTYATAYFVLAAGFLISGIVCMTGGFIIIVIEENNKRNGAETNSELQEGLPPL